MTEPTSEMAGRRLAFMSRFGDLKLEFEKHSGSWRCEWDGVVAVAGSIGEAVQICFRESCEQDRHMRRLAVEKAQEVAA